jgi:hypothetical protein
MQIGIPTEHLSAKGIHLTDDEIICIIRAIVGNHQIINQISAEASDKYICEKIAAIQQTFHSSASLTSLFSEEFVDIMFLLAAADVMAVDDTILSAEKFEEMVESRMFLKKVCNNDSYERDHKRFGIKRLISLLPDESKINAEVPILSYVNSHENAKCIYEFLYDLKYFSYAMAAIKPLNDTFKSIKLIDLCCSIAQIAQIPFTELVLKFDPDINTDRLAQVLDLEIADILDHRLVQFSYDKVKATIDVNC